MKYCSKCGKELVDDAVICTACGCSVEQPQNINTKSSNSKIQTAFVLNVIALIVSLAAISIVMLMNIGEFQIGDTNQKRFSEILEMKNDYENAKFAEENYLNENKEDKDVKEYVDLDIATEIDDFVEYNGSDVKFERLTNSFAQGRENSKIIKCIELTWERAKAEKLYKEYENEYEATVNTLILFGFLFVLVLIAFVLSVITKIKLNKNSNKKGFAWIYLSFVLLEDIVYILVSFILFVYIICGVGILVPVAPILQTIAATKFLQATKE